MSMVEQKILRCAEAIADTVAKVGEFGMALEIITDTVIYKLPLGPTVDTDKNIRELVELIDSIYYTMPDIATPKNEEDEKPYYVE